MRTFRLLLTSAALAATATVTFGVLGASPAAASGDCPPNQPCGGQMPQDPAPPTTQPAPPTTQPAPPTTRPVPPTTQPAPPTTRPVPPTTRPTTPATQAPRPAQPPVVNNPEPEAPAAPVGEPVVAETPVAEVPVTEPARADATPESVRANACPAVEDDAWPWWVWLLIGAAVGALAMFIAKRRRNDDEEEDETDEVEDDSTETDEVEDDTTGDDDAALYEDDTAAK